VRKWQSSEIFRSVLHNSRPFLSNLDQPGRSNLFLSACGPRQMITLSKNTGWSLANDIIQRISDILQLGFSMDDTDNEGANCLHQSFSAIASFAKFEIPCLDWVEVLVFLIKKGADVFHRDRHGNSVSDLAYSMEFCHFGSACSSAGDIWDAALSRCGHDLRIFRATHPRKVRYGKHHNNNSIYSRTDFEYLWKGREKSCPYWDDKVWPEPENVGPVDIPWYRIDKDCLCRSCRWWYQPNDPRNISQDYS
jgi:hypothetical protein